MKNRWTNPQLFSWRADFPRPAGAQGRLLSFCSQPSHGARFPVPPWVVLAGTALLECQLDIPGSCQRRRSRAMPKRPLIPPSGAAERSSEKGERAGTGSAQRTPAATGELWAGVRGRMDGEGWTQLWRWVGWCQEGSGWWEGTGAAGTAAAGGNVWSDPGAGGSWFSILLMEWLQSLGWEVEGREVLWKAESGQGGEEICALFCRVWWHCVHGSTGSCGGIGSCGDTGFCGVTMSTVALGPWWHHVHSGVGSCSDTGF